MQNLTAKEANTAGMTALRSGDAATAVAAFKHATSLDPLAGPLWRNLAHAERAASNTKGERAALDRALSLDRTDFVAQLRLAQLLERTGNEAEALLAWTGALQFSAQVPVNSPQLEAELAAGEAYCDALRDRLSKAADATMAIGAADRDETEERRISAFVGAVLGRRKVYHNQCAGVHYPFLPEDEFFDRKHFPWFAELEAAAPAIRAELAELLMANDDALRPYVRLEEGTPQNDWSALDGSLDWGACFLWEYGTPNEEVVRRCPATADILAKLPLARIPGRAPNAFFSLLRPHSKIPPHTGVTNTRAIVHLALDIPAGCGFRVGNETREWQEGRAFAFDDTIEHEAWNNSDFRRAVLIIDTWNPHLSLNEQEAITAHFVAADAALSKGGDS